MSDICGKGDVWSTRPHTFAYTGGTKMYHVNADIIYGEKCAPTTTICHYLYHEWHIPSFFLLRRGDLPISSIWLLISLTIWSTSVEYRVISVIEDSDRLNAEQNLARTYAYNRTLIEVSPNPLVTIGPDGKIQVYLRMS